MIDPAFGKEFHLFDRNFSTTPQRSRGWLEARQHDAESYGSPPVRYLLDDRQATLLHGRIISEESGEFSGHFRSYYIDPDNVTDTAKRFLSFADQFYEQINPVQRIPAFSFAAYIVGTDRYLEKPPEGPIQSISIPWTMSSAEDLFIVPDRPMHLRRNQLKEAGLAVEITALFREKFEER